MADDNNLTALTAWIVEAFVQGNKVQADALPGLIHSTHQALKGLGEAPVEVEPEFEKPSTSDIRRSVSDKGIVSFIDGRTYQSLKRHLTSNGLTPAEYRERYGLRPDYPLVAPAYAAKRSALAKAAGLGKGGRQPAKRGRKPKAG